MPFAGATSVFITITTPSGLIPSGKDSGRQWSFDLIAFLCVSQWSFVPKKT
jgi:hypothetical protein